MAKDVRQIRIESILGGIGQSAIFQEQDGYRSSLGIDPGLPINDDDTGFLGSQPSGILRPISVFQVANTTATVPLWMKPSPKDENYYILGSNGSTYTLDGDAHTLSEISDGGNESGTGSGNGCAYYDNYIYFAKNTTIARYGPLNGTPELNGDYWGTTLSKTALTHTAYPLGGAVPGGYGATLPNHILHRHSDGKLYIADVVGNLGTIHYIATTKTTVEGDTDNNSTYNKVQFGYGLYPTAMESYGNNLVIALWEGGVSTALGNEHSGQAKLAFWDTTSQNINQIIWVGFPNEIITSLTNSNGELYLTSMSFSGNSGFRLSRYVGGNSFETVFVSKTAKAPYPGGVVAIGEQLLFGSYLFTSGTSEGCVFSKGLSSPALGTGIFPLYSLKGYTGFTPENDFVTTIAIDPKGDRPIMGWGNLVGHTGGGIEFVSSGNSNFSSPVYGSNTVFWQSQQFNIGQRFKITKVRIPLGQAIASGMVIQPTIYLDEDNLGQSLSAINFSNYPNGETNVVIRPNSVTGNHSFYLELRWEGTTTLAVVSLPITIEYELLDD